MKKYWVFFIPFILFGCRVVDTRTTLTTNSISSFYSSSNVTTSIIETSLPSSPTDLLFNPLTNMLTWQVNSSADKYLVFINGIQYESMITQLSLVFLPSGEYSIFVQAVQLDGISTPSTTILVSLNTVRSFTDINFDNNILSFQEFSGDISYILNIMDGQRIITTRSISNNSQLAIDTNVITHYQIIAYENDIAIDTYEFYVYPTYIFDFNQIDDFSISELYELRSVSLNQKLLGDEDFHYNQMDSRLTLSRDFVQDLEVGSYTLRIESLHTIFVPVEIKEAKIPELVGQSVVSYQLMNVIYTFQLYGGTFENIFGYGITSSDYTFDGTQLTIYSSFIDRVILANSTLSMLMLSYTLYNHPHSVIGYIVIMFGS